MNFSIEISYLYGTLNGRNNRENKKLKRLFGNFDSFSATMLNFLFHSEIRLFKNLLVIYLLALSPGLTLRCLI